MSIQITNLEIRLAVGYFWEAKLLPHSELKALLCKVHGDPHENAYFYAGTRPHNDGLFLSLEKGELVEVIRYLIDSSSSLCKKDGEELIRKLSANESFCILIEIVSVHKHPHLDHKNFTLE